VKPIALSAEDKQDLLAFLMALTDETLLTNPALSDPLHPSSLTTKAAPNNVIRGVVTRVYSIDGEIALNYDTLPAVMAAMGAPYPTEFIVPDKKSLESLRRGERIVAAVRRQGSDWVLEEIQKTGPR